MEAPYLSKKEIISSIKFSGNFTRIVLLLFVFLVLLFLTMTMYVGSLLLAYASVFGTFAICAWLLLRSWHKRFGNYNVKLYPNQMNARFLWIYMREQFENVEFNSLKQIPEEVVRLPGFSFEKDSTTYKASNYISAAWGPTAIEAQITTLGCIETHYNTSSGPGRPSVYHALDPKFKGMLYLCHTGIPFTPTTVHTGKRLTGEIKTGDADFDRLFSVQTQDPRSMPLSDGMRRFLTEAAGNIHCKVHIHFAAGGDVYFAFNQRVYEDRLRKDLKAFEKLELQAHLVKGTLSMLSGGADRHPSPS